MRIAYYCPIHLEDALAYDRALLPELAHKIELERFVEVSALSEVSPDPAFPTFEQALFEERHEEAPYDLSMYQIGDHPAYYFAWETLRRRPGIVALQSLNLHRLYGRHQPDSPSYKQIMAEGYGEIGRALAEYRAQGIGGQFDERATPLGWIVAARALGVIVHTREALAYLRQKLPAMPISLVSRPVSIQLPVQLEDQAALRQRLGLRPEGLIVASFGFLPTDRRECLARAYGRLLREHPGAILVAAAQDPRDASLWEEILRAYRLLGAARVLEVGESEVALSEVVAVTDIGLYLRTPHLGEMPEIPLRLMAAAKATILSTARGLAELPEDCCAFTEPGPGEEDLLWAYLQLLADQPGTRQRTGENAQEYIRTIHAPTAAARGYLRLMEEVRQLLERRQEPTFAEPTRMTPIEVDAASLSAGQRDVPSSEPEEKVLGEIDVDTMMEEIRLRIGEQYLVERPPLPTFRSYRHPPTSGSIEEKELLDSIGQANHAWDLTRPPSEDALRGRSRRDVQQAILTYLNEVLQQQVDFNASVVRTLNGLVRKLFDPAVDVESTSLRYQVQAIHQRLAELEKRIPETS